VIILQSLVGPRAEGSPFGCEPSRRPRSRLSFSLMVHTESQSSIRPFALSEHLVVPLMTSARAVRVGSVVTAAMGSPTVRLETDRSPDPRHLCVSYGIDTEC
jgi:hypothetical protein